MSAKAQALRDAVLAHLVAHGRTTTNDLYAAVGGTMRRSVFDAAVRYMRSVGYVQNVAGPGVTGVWVADMSELPGALQPGADAAAQEPAEPIHDYPRYCLERVPPPRQHDTRQCTGWRPPAMACTRPGAADFLSLPSRVGEQRNPHQPGYIAALASDHNTPADA